MHIDIVPNRDSRPTYLLRESFREGTHVRKRTLANLSALSDEQIFRPSAPCCVARALTVGHASALRGDRASRASWPRAGRARSHAASWGWRQLLAARPSRARSGVRDGRCAHHRPAHQAWPPRAGGTPRPWPRTSAWPMPARTRCTRRWTGCSSARTRSRRSSPRATSRRWPGALRSVVELLRRQHLSAGQARLQP
jgi:hypothetical protein